MGKELRKYIKTIIGAKISYSRAGGGAGSIISMDVRNKDNSIYSLWVECAWRIENKNKIIATSADSVEASNGLIAQSVKMLENKVIKSIKLTNFYDLLINFTDGFCLKVFCIFSYDCEPCMNWYLAIPEQDLCYEITNFFNVKKGKYYSNDEKSE